MAVDYFGNEVKVGDIVIHASDGARGKSAGLTEHKVAKVSEKCIYFEEKYGTRVELKRRDAGRNIIDLTALGVEK